MDESSFSSKLFVDIIISLTVGFPAETKNLIFSSSDEKRNKPSTSS